MAPSIAENPTAEVVVPVKVSPQASTSKPNVRRIIEEEGGKSTASVRNTLVTIRAEIKLIGDI
jgi:taurine dioxygenase/sulfonate dioxygenase